MAWSKHGHQPKMIQVRCQCGCNEIFGAIVISNRPRYKNKTHQMRAYRRRLKEKSKPEQDARAGEWKFQCGVELNDNEIAIVYERKVRR